MNATAEAATNCPTRVVIVEGVSNADFLEQHALPGRVGLCGGVDLINKAIRKLQHPVRARKLQGFVDGSVYKEARTEPVGDGHL